MSTKKTSLVYSRYELKYQIHIDQVAEIEKYIEPFCNLDHYSSIEDDNYYTINSLYFDAPNFLFLTRKQDKVAQRFSMRARSYGEAPKPPYFLEIKEKDDDVVNKKRVQIDFENWEDLFTDSALADSLKGASKEYFLEFINHFITNNVEPKILTRYRRKAYFSTIDDYVRITFDKELQFQNESGFNIKPSNDMVQSYDTEESFKGSGGNVVFEIKCLTQVPHWVLDMISHFGLTRNSFSKYENSVITSSLADLHDDAVFDAIATVR